MYYMDRALMARKLTFLLELAAWFGAWRKTAETPLSTEVPISGLALERLLQLAVETVTDVGHMLIDCFMMRDPGSYEDIIQVLYEEHLFDADQYRLLLALVQLKGALSKTYEVRVTASELMPLVSELALHLPQFAAAVREFMEKEFGKIS
jgi:uncharacterized protein YutE (UPF0331/DUF86 family)